MLLLTSLRWKLRTVRSRGSEVKLVIVLTSGAAAVGGGSDTRHPRHEIWTDVAPAPFRTRVPQRALYWIVYYRNSSHLERFLVMGCEAGKIS